MAAKRFGRGDRVPALFDIGLISGAKAFRQAHDAVLQLGAFKIADAVERRELAFGKLADPLDNRFDQIGFGVGELLALRDLFDPSVHADGEQLVLGGGGVWCHRFRIPRNVWKLRMHRRRALGSEWL